MMDSESAARWAFVDPVCRSLHECDFLNLPPLKFSPDIPHDLFLIFRMAFSCTETADLPGQK